MDTVAGKRAAAAALIADAQLSTPVDPPEACELLTVNQGGARSGIDDVDLWVGGLAESNDPIGGGGNLLGPTFDHVFRTTLEDLQEGDRFYYLDRLAGLSLLTEIEGNTISEMFIRNTDAVDLPKDLFAVPGLTIQMQADRSPDLRPVADPRWQQLHGNRDDGHVHWAPEHPVRRDARRRHHARRCR